MSTQSTTSHEGEAGKESTRNESTSIDGLARAKRAAADGSGALLVGAALLLGSVRARRRGGRDALRGVVGLALVGLGLHQRRAKDGEDLSQTTDEDSVGDVSDEAAVKQPLHDVEKQAEGNPRDVSKDSDVETDEDEGDVQFSRERDLEPRQEPDLEGEGAEDPRQNDDLDDDDVEIDISKAAMADEPNEAAGPTSAQAQPTTMKDAETVPEDSASLTEDASDKQADSDESSQSDDSEDDFENESEDGNESSDGDDDESNDGDDNESNDGDDNESEDRETVEAEGGAELHTDTMEAGTMDIDEDDVTVPDDELNEERADSEQQSSSRLDDESENDN